MRLLGQLAHVERTHCPTKPDMELVDPPLAEREELHSVEPQMLVEVSEVLLVARQSIDRLCDHDVKLTAPRILQKSLIPRAKIGWYPSRHDLHMPPRTPSPLVQHAVDKPEADPRYSKDFACRY